MTTFKAKHRETGEVVEFSHFHNGFEDIYISQKTGTSYHELGFNQFYTRLEPEAVNIPSLKTFDKQGNIIAETVVMGGGGNKYVGGSNLSQPVVIKKGNVHELYIPADTLNTIEAEIERIARSEELEDKVYKILEMIDSEYAPSDVPELCVLEGYKNALADTLAIISKYKN